MKLNVKLSVLSFMLPMLTVFPSLAADYQLQTLEKAQAMFRAATNATMYAEAARHYNYLVEEEGLRNGQLFYTLGNTWFMAGDVGRAILNYRRAENYLPNNLDVQYNLKSALEMRTDLIPEKNPPPLVSNLLGWHLNTPPALRWWIFAISWPSAWGAMVWARRTRKKEARITAAVAGVLSVAMIASLLTETIQKRLAEPGVITTSEVLARKGDGEMYAPAFLDPLHSGTEFQRLETRGNWWYIRLADGQTCWIPSSAAETLAFSD